MHPPRIGLFGGSFDPVHAGHIHVARAAEAACGLDRIVFVPAARPPHKPGVRLAGGADRIAMLELALAGEPRWSTSAVELGREGPSYTVDTVAALPEALGLTGPWEPWLLIGSDNLAGLPHWRKADELLARVRVAVIAREGDSLEIPPELVGSGERLRVLRLPPVPVSATDLRAALGRGENVDAWLPAGVGEYVRRRGLYAGSP